MQAHLAPVPDRQNGHLDLAQPFEGGALAPPCIVEGVLGDGRRRDRTASAAVRCRRRDDAGCRRAGWRTTTIGSCRKCRRDNSSSGTGRRVRHRARCRRGRAGSSRHQPLRHGVIGLSDAADAAVAPGLAGHPGDQLDVILLLGAIHESEFALGAARAAHVCVHIGVALPHVPFDRPGLAPEKQRKGRHGVELVLVGRGGKQCRYASGLRRAVDTDRNAHPVAHRDLDVALDGHGVSGCGGLFARSMVVLHVLAASRPLLHCAAIDLKHDPEKLQTFRIRSCDRRSD